VEFSPELRESVLAGDITVSFRLWRRPKVKPGGRYRVGRGQIEVDEVDLVPFASITVEEVSAAGERDRESLRRRAAHSGPIADDTMLYRIEFHVVGTRPSPRDIPMDKKRIAAVRAEGRGTDR
jgi:hypothetical protein